MNKMNPNEVVKTIVTETGVSVLTAGMAAGYPLLRAAVDYLRAFDDEGFAEYCKIKDNGGEKTVESRRAAYKFAFVRAGEMIVSHYNRDFTASPEPKPEFGDGCEEGTEG